MLYFLHLPIELIYSKKGKISYEKYLADDPTGINQVLDKMYGAAFKNTQVSLKYRDPSIYFDNAYDIAIRIWNQKYPNRYVRMDAVFSDIEVSLDYSAPKPSTDDINLVALMAYALLGLRKERSPQLEEFLDGYLKYLTDLRGKTHNLVLRDVFFILQNEVVKKHTYDSDLSPKPASPDKLPPVIFAQELPHLKEEQDIVSIIQLYADSSDQLAFYHALVSQGVVPKDNQGFARRIESGEFELAKDIPRHFQVSEDAPPELQHFVDLCNEEVVHWREKAEYYQKKCECLEKAAQLSELTASVENLRKGIDEHQQQLMDEQKEKYTAMLDERNERLLRLVNDVKEMNKRSVGILKLLDRLKTMIEVGDCGPKTITFTLTDENIEKLKNGEDVEFDVMENPITRQPDVIQNVVLGKVLDFLIDYAKDIDAVSEAQLPSIRYVLTMLLDNDNLTGQMDGSVYRKYSHSIHQLEKERKLRKNALDKQRHDEELAARKAMQSPTIHVQGDLVAQKQMVDKSYGDNYNLEAGATCQPAASQEQLQTILKRLDDLTPHPIPLPEIDEMLGNEPEPDIHLEMNSESDIHRERIPENDTSRKETGDEHIQ